MDKISLGSYLGGAGADVASTAYFQTHPKLGITEQNPLINWAPTGAQLPIGLAMEGLTGVLLNKALKNHPNWRRAALLGAGAVHTGLAANNVRLIRNAQGK